MEKLKNLSILFKNAVFGMNFALFILLSYTFHAIYRGAVLADAFIFIAASALYGYTLYLKSKKPEPIQINAEVQAQINEIQKRIRDTQMENNIKPRTLKW